MKATSFIQKQKKKIITAIAALNVAALSVNHVFAAPPGGVDTGAYSGLIDIVFWVATIAIAAGGGTGSGAPRFPPPRRRGPKPWGRGVSSG